MGIFDKYSDAEERYDELKPHLKAILNEVNEFNKDDKNRTNFINMCSALQKIMSDSKNVSDLLVGKVAYPTKASPIIRSIKESLSLFKRYLLGANVFQGRGQVHSELLKLKKEIEEFLNESEKLVKATLPKVAEKKKPSIVKTNEVDWY